MIDRITKGIVIFPIRLYQIVLSPFLQNVFGMRCRYEPSCSYYMIDAIKEWGIFRGLYMGTKRILSCNPWGGHGYDPVPKNPKKQPQSPKE